jgi:hypothetical protein
MSDQPVARPLPKHRTTQTQSKRIHTPNIHALIGIWTHDPSVRASEDRSKPRGYCDQRWYNLPSLIYFRKFHRQHQCTMQLVRGHGVFRLYSVQCTVRWNSLPRFERYLNVGSHFEIWSAQLCAGRIIWHAMSLEPQTTQSKHGACLWTAGAWQSNCHTTWKHTHLFSNTCYFPRYCSVTELIVAYNLNTSCIVRTNTIYIYLQ